MRLAQATLAMLLLGGLVLASGSERAAAQGAPSGFELALSGDRQVYLGRPAHYRGVAYRVHGLAELRPLAGAVVRARYATDAEGAKPEAWREVRADGRGFFQLDVPMPERTEGTPALEVSVGDGRDDERSFTFPLAFVRPWLLDLVTDRHLYEPGETVRVWARLRDARSRRPLTGVSIRFTLAGTIEGARSVATDASGVAFLTAPIAKEAAEGEYGVVAAIGEETRTVSYRVGTRTTERLFTDVTLAPKLARPHEPVEVTVKVTSASGAPVRDAAVQVKVDDAEPVSARADAQGIARIGVRAPAYLTHATGVVPVAVEVEHPAYGAAAARESLRLAVPLLLEIEAIAPNAGLVPEVDGVLYLRLADGAGDPPAAGTPVEVLGPAVRGGRARAASDASGLVAVPTRLPRGAAAAPVLIDGDWVPESGGSARVTTVTVQVGGAAPRTALLRVPVRWEVEVVPTVDRPVVAPGDALVVTLSRRAGAVRLPVVVEIFSPRGPVEARVVEPGVTRVALTAPRDQIGVFQVRARPLVQDGVVEGVGGLDAFLVRPARPSFPELQVGAEVHAVRSKARLTLRTAPGAAQSWVAVLVRDLALHGGESPFRLRFLEEQFDRAVLDPAAPGSELLLRTALAAFVAEEVAPRRAPPLLDELGQPLFAEAGLEVSPDRQVLRDPFPLADELRRRGIGQVERQLEALLAAALEEGRLGEITVGRGPARRFRPDVLEELEGIPTLGDGALTLAMIEASDPSFRYEAVARRVARARLVRLLVVLSRYLDPGDGASPQRRAAAREPHERWLARMVERGLIGPEQLVDPWGGTFALQASAAPSLVVAVEAAGLELVSPGPDGRPGTADDVRDPFARVVPPGTPYAVASGEDLLVARLSTLSPGADVLRRMLEAYQRVAAEIAEAEIGDAVSASVSEGLEDADLYGSMVGEGLGGGGFGTVGHGSGTGSGYGYGSGRGGMRGRAARVPTIGLAGIVRERFPPTLLFAPALPVDPSGQTSIEVELPDAVTTYLVEAVVWSADGWTASAAARIRVDKEIVVDAPVPLFATVGDLLRVPVRVANRTASDVTVAVVLLAADDAEPVERRGVAVPARDAIEVEVPITLSGAREGRVLVGVRSQDAGAPLDAVRRPMTVQAASRRVRRTAEMLASGTGSLTLEVPAQASPRDGAEVILRVGVGLFAVPEEPVWAAWAEAWQGRGTVGPEVMRTLVGGTGAPLARAIGACWGAPAVSDAQLSDGLTRLARGLGTLASGRGSPDMLGDLAEVLLGLAPAVRRIGARPGLARDLEAILRQLRAGLEGQVVGVADAPGLWAQAAAALAWTAPPRADLGRVRELVRRARRHELRVGEDSWVAAVGDRHHAATALLALAEVKLGEREPAFGRVRTLGRLEVERRGLDARSRALARALTGLLGAGTAPAAAVVQIDGRTERVALAGGLGRLPAAALASPGSHQIRVDVPGSPVALHVEAVTEFGMPWDVLPERPGSLLVTIEGETGGRDARAALELVVRNRSPRTIGRPVLEVSLPAGAELDEHGRAAMRRRTSAEPDATRGTLRLALGALPPGGVRRVPLPLRWSVGGRLHGLGVASYPADQPEDVSITPPRILEIGARAVEVVR